MRPLMPICGNFRTLFDELLMGKKASKITDKTIAKLIPNKVGTIKKLREGSHNNFELNKIEMSIFLKTFMLMSKYALVGLFFVFFSAKFIAQRNKIQAILTEL